MDDESRRQASDAALMTRVASGDANAFEETLNRYEAPVLRFLRRTLRNDSDADDVAANTFLRLYRSRNAYRPQLPFRPYLFAIARHALAEFLSARASPEPKADAIDESASPEQAVSGREEIVRVRAQVDRLPEPFREAVTLCYFDGLSPAEVAEVLGANASTVRTRLARGLTILRERLNP